eukprot:13660433-Alexandrium_andersonii.AAC.1
MHGGMQYVQVAQPLLVMMENVKQIDHVKSQSAQKQSDLDVVRAEFNSMGYIMAHSVMNAAYRGAAHHRSRMFMLAFRVSDQPVDQVAEGWRAPYWFAGIFSFLEKVKLQPYPLECFLLDPESEDVRAHQAELAALGDRRGEALPSG